MVCNASSRAYEQALDFLRYAGTLVCVGIPEIDPHPMPKTAPWQIIVNQWKIKGAVTGNRQMAVDCLKPTTLGQVHRARPKAGLGRIHRARLLDSEYDQQCKPRLLGGDLQYYVR
ncbi:hypothetical protein LTS07_011374 [Exophiala sideris]|uniref:Uncharacterized protein n=1 Tax=Exophiala sideris TaxID=1016849 RepID=A0ABR0IW87_9EURO|nr:hypothetical protein LTS07_011374 [Exophiala sideris]KAK5048415.1 hypothetical protein LTR69_011403 [Exophiala sideris]